jgi:hypothetical protein
MNLVSSAVPEVRILPCCHPEGAKRRGISRRKHNVLQSVFNRREAPFT